MPVPAQADQQDQATYYGREKSSDRCVPAEAGRKRADLRMPVSLMATLDCNGGAIRVRLVDMSRTGALAEAVNPPSPGAAVLVRLDRMFIPARISWVHRQRFGIEFDERIRASDLLIRVHESRRPPH